ncbi:hypothetical protein KO507_12245 [Gilvimarinus agarilyticus]|uniref:hypothetical protein n=1 Tax=unclassified Gilvimarinus TaxID=2642066 RepID=UPI001C085C70|nr:MULTISPECIES: hypothetical protein [unclassified Gilvimarinus]MBU2886534.1 hypothetical protein [Gilvimarinus agarilyticus]MDO6571202.1 hypothetical protein [Gilvimarinus sp. 2_MG-2023]MDO6746416.1 hypothetical protein [Gilvimarinus sp. 1_MG-2023]
MMFNRKTPQAATEAIQHAGLGAMKSATNGATRVTTGNPFIKDEVQDKRITDVPTSLVSAHASWKPAGSWQGRFDLAAWMRLPQGCPVPLHLALRYTDQRGEHTVMVDICKPGSYKSVLLNGSIEVVVSGRVKDMGLYLVNLPTDIPLGLEEWHFQPQIKR